MAKTKSGAEAEALYLQAFEKFSQAIEIKPDKHEPYNNWGTYLGKLAETKSGLEAEALYLQAFDKFSKATEIKPDDHEVYNNWVNNLMALAKTKTGSEADELYLQAFEKLNKGVAFGGNSYNLACLNTLTKNLEEAFRLLEFCLKNNEITFEHVKTDPDWDNLREEPDYKKLEVLFAK